MAQSPEDSHPLGYLLTKVAQATASRFALAVAELGIDPRHYGALAALAQDPAANQQRLAQTLGVSPSRMVSVVDQLEALGMLVRRRDLLNRRQFVLEVTDHGRELLAAATRLGREVDDQIWAHSSTADRTAMHAGLLRATSFLDVGVRSPAPPAS